jgi:ABC-type antimicrobial peptide transport system permease subunit
MGFLTDLRSGKRGDAFGHAIFAWAIIGASIGIGSALLFVQSENAIPILATIGGLLGMSVGFYAEWGTSKFAKLLAVPAMILELVRSARP